MKTTKNIITDKKMELVSLLIQDCKSTGYIQSKLKRLFAGAIRPVPKSMKHTVGLNHVCQKTNNFKYWVDAFHAYIWNFGTGLLSKCLKLRWRNILVIKKHSLNGNNTGNSRNGYNYKTIFSNYGKSRIAVPQDRNGEFEPKVLEKRQVRTDEIEQKIMTMYAKGMNQGDIEESLKEIYGAEILQTLISKITNKILPEVNKWQNRPVESIYPIIYFDGIVFKTYKDSQIINKCVYSVMGIDMDRQKDILGIWLSENESSSFLLT